MQRITKKWIVVIVILAVLIVGVVLFTKRLKSKEPFENGKIPKKIYTYWDSLDKMPTFVQKCIDSWKKYNDTYEIHVLTKDTVDEYVSIPDEIKNHPNFNDTRSRFADLVRLYLLDQHGGIWIDASCLMYQGFDEWLPFQSDIYCYTYNQGRKNLQYPVLENWFIAAKPNIAFIAAWKKEFLEIANYASVNEYIQSRKAMGVDISFIEHAGDYLAMHVAAQKLIQKNKLSLKNIEMHESSEGGPFWFLIKNGWNSKRAIEEVCVNKDMRKPFLKFHGPSRDEMIKLLDSDMTNERCEWFNASENNSVTYL